MTDIIDGIGQILQAELNMPYAGQEPQDKDGIPTSGLAIIERVGGGMSAHARSDRPWVQFTVLAQSKKKAHDMLRRIRLLMAEPRVNVGGFFVYGAREVLNPEEASLPSDPFYRARCAFEVHVKGLA